MRYFKTYSDESYAKEVAQRYGGVVRQRKGKDYWGKERTYYEVWIPEKPKVTPSPQVTKPVERKQAKLSDEEVAVHLSETVSRKVLEERAKQGDPYAQAALQVKKERIPYVIDYPNKKIYIPSKYSHYQSEIQKGLEGSGFKVVVKDVPEHKTTKQHLTSITVPKIVKKREVVVAGSPEKPEAIELPELPENADVLRQPSSTMPDFEVEQPDLTVAVPVEKQVKIEPAKFVDDKIIKQAEYVEKTTYLIGDYGLTSQVATQVERKPIEFDIRARRVYESMSEVGLSGTTALSYIVPPSEAILGAGYTHIGISEIASSLRFDVSKLKIEVTDKERLKEGLANLAMGNVMMLSGAKATSDLLKAAKAGRKSLVVEDIRVISKEPSVEGRIERATVKLPKEFERVGKINYQSQLSGLRQEVNYVITKEDIAEKILKSQHEIREYGALQGVVEYSPIGVEDLMNPEIRMMRTVQPIRELKNIYFVYKEPKYIELIKARVGEGGAKADLIGLRGERYTIMQSRWFDVEQIKGKELEKLAVGKVSGIRYEKLKPYAIETEKITIWGAKSPKSAKMKPFEFPVKEEIEKIAKPTLNKEIYERADYSLLGEKLKHVMEGPIDLKKGAGRLPYGRFSDGVRIDICYKSDIFDIVDNIKNIFYVGRRQISEHPSGVIAQIFFNIASSLPAEKSVRLIKPSTGKDKFAEGLLKRTDVKVDVIPERFLSLSGLRDLMRRLSFSLGQRQLARQRQRQRQLTRLKQLTKTKQLTKIDVGINIEPPEIEVPVLPPRPRIRARKGKKRKKGRKKAFDILYKTPFAKLF